MRKLRPFVDEFVDPELTPHRVELLKKIFVHDRQGGIHQWRLVAEFAVCKSSISRMLSKMERDGFIKRFWTRAGRKFVQLTDRGRAIIDKLRTLAEEREPHARVAKAFVGDPTEPVDYRDQYRVLNWIRFRLDDNAPFLQPWRLRDLYEKADLEDGLLGRYVACRIKPDDFDDFVEGEHFDEGA